MEKGKTFRAETLKLLFLAATLMAGTLNAQISMLDSSLALLKNEKDDKKRANLLSGIAHDYVKKDLDKMYEYAIEALNISKKIGYTEGLCYATAELGTYYEHRGELPSAMDNYTRALRLAEEINNPSKISSLCINMGNLFFSQGDLKDAKKYYEKSLKLAEELGYEEAASRCYHNIAGCFYMEKDYERCFEWLNRHIGRLKKMNDPTGLAHALNNMSDLYASQGRFPEALAASDSALAISIRIMSPGDIAGNLSTKATIFAEMGKSDKALALLKSALDTASRIHDEMLIMNIYQYLVPVYAGKKDFENAYRYQQRYQGLKDSVFRSDFSKQISEMEARYKSELKDKELIKMESEKKILEADSERKSMQRNVSVAGLIMVLLLTLFVFRSYRQKKKANAIISSQKQLVEQQKDLVEQQKKDILDSIYYARRIQESLLPPEIYIERWLTKLRGKNKV